MLFECVMQAMKSAYITHSNNRQFCGGGGDLAILALLPPPPYVYV